MNGVWRRPALHIPAHALALIALLLAVPSPAHAAAITMSWTAPTTNANGTRLTDLASYRIYLGTSTPACPGGSFHTVASPTSSPTAGQTVSSRIASLTASTTYYARVTAIDTSGNESACTGTVSGVARADLSVTPTTTVSFGSIAPGATVDRTFTVQNVSSTTVSGSASVGAPFAIVSGGSLSLGAGASQSVVVRFRPTSSGTFTSNLNVTANGDTTNRTVTGTATGTTTSTTTTSSSGTLSVYITAPTSGATVTSSGSAVLWAEGTSGSTNTFTLSADGRTTGSQTTSSRGPVSLPWTGLSGGSHTLTATVRDATGKSGSRSITVNVPGGTTATSTTSSTSTSSGSLNVAITSPSSGATVSANGSAVLWVEGTSGSANTFTLSVDGRTTGSQTTSSRGPISLPWTGLSGGSHTLTATVRDATGKSGSRSITINVPGGTSTATSTTSSTSPSTTLRLAMTEPDPGQTVSGLVWVILWVDGAQGSSYSFWIAVDGDVVGGLTTGQTGPVAIPWSTTTVGNGTHTVMGVVRDGGGRTASTSVTVTARN